MAFIGTINSDVQFRNRIINGDINIDQRFGGTANTPVGASAGTYVIDRWCFQCSPASKISIQQMQVANSSASNYEASSAPAGFINSMKFTVASANTVSAGDYYNLYQAVEGVNVQDLDWGTAAAKPVTLSFWVKSSVVGTYTGALKNADVNRSYPYTYTISSANTWEQKTVTITGDTTGTWKKDNTVGIYVGFNLGAGASFTGGTVNTWSAINTQGVTGQTSLQGASNSGATWYLTGVQLEPGSTATPFEHRPFGMELALCQRYYYSWSSSGLSDLYFHYSPYVSSPPNSSASVGYFFPVTMRANPTMVGTGLSLNRFTANRDGAVSQLGSTSGATAYSLSAFTATAEL